MAQLDHKICARPPQDTPSGWLPVKALTPIGDTPSPEEVLDFDLVVIGAGFTGLAAARRYAELNPGETVALVDAKPVGWGASGRNSGFIIDLPHKFDLDSRDPVRLATIMRLNKHAISLLKGHVSRFDIECEWSEVGKLQGAVRHRGTGKLRQFKEALELIGQEYTHLDRDDVEKITGTRYYSGAVHTSGCVLMNPVKLTRGLAMTMPSNVTIYDTAPIVSFEHCPNGHYLECQHGGVTSILKARKILFCANAYASQFGYLKRRIIPVVTFASMTRPLTEEELASFTGGFDWGLTPADAGGTTLRMTQDRRLLIRNQYDYAGRYGAADDHLEHVRQLHRQSLVARYPQFERVPFASTWGGICGLSSNHASYFGKLDETVWGSVCHNGVGVARGTVSGHLLAEAASDRDSDMLSSMYAVSNRLTVNPPDPLLGIGVRARLRMEAWNSRTEV